MSEINRASATQQAQNTSVDSCAKDSIQVPLIVRELRQRREVLRCRERDICNQLDTIAALLRALEG